MMKSRVKEREKEREIVGKFWNRISNQIKGTSLHNLIIKNGVGWCCLQGLTKIVYGIMGKKKGTQKNGTNYIFNLIDIFYKILITLLKLTL